jgi:DNA-binding transcriptional MerR regulator
VLFADGKDAAALRTIGELADALGIRQHVLRYWEQQFDMLRPLKRSGGRRYYRPEDVALIVAINRLVNDEGYTLKGAAQVLGKGGIPVPPAAEPVTAAPEFARPAPSNPEPSARQTAPDVLPQLRAIRARLEAALADA